MHLVCWISWESYIAIGKFNYLPANTHVILGTELHVAFNIFVHLLKVGNDFIFLFLFCFFSHIFLQLQDGQWATVLCSCYEPMPLSVERLIWNMNFVTVAFSCISSTIKRMFSVLKLYLYFWKPAHRCTSDLVLFPASIKSPNQKDHSFTCSLSFEFVLIFNEVIDILQWFPNFSQFYRIFFAVVTFTVSDKCRRKSRNKGNFFAFVCDL